MLSNGRLQDDTDYSSISAAGDLQHANWIRAVVLEVLGASYIGANQSHNRSRDAKSYTAPGRYFGYFLDIRISEPDQIDQMHLGAVIKSALCDVLQAHHLLPVPDTITAASRSRRLQLKSESPTKKVRGCDSVMVDKACKHSAIASGRRFTLDRTGLLREPTQARSQDTQAEWLTDVLLSWKSVLPSNLPVEERFLALTDKQCDAASGYFDEERGQVLQKAGLATSRVTGQVDAKYISIVYGEDTLILVDQHAAHERVRLEALLSRYWTDCSERHSARLHNVRETSRLVDLSSHLARVFEEDDTVQSLDYWGFIIAHGSVQEGNTTVEVEAIPEILEGKLGSEQALRLFVIDLAASLEDKSVRQRMKLPVTSLFQSNKANGWIAALRHLPTPLLDLFNSMACRGAISKSPFVYLADAIRLIRSLVLQCLMIH
jgi:DNA mismatch repair ATPase MutL